MGKASFEQSFQQKLNNGDQLKLELMQLKVQLKELGLRDVWVMFKIYFPEYKRAEFISRYYMRQSDSEFNNKIKALIKKLKS